MDLDAGTLTVQRNLQRYSGAYHLDETKTARSRRTIPVPDPVIRVLRAHKARQLEERLRAGTAWEGDAWDLVFATERGTPLYGSWITKRFQRKLEAAGLPRQRFHDLRHAAASFMVAQGVSLRTVMEVLGHSQIGVTANTYSHVTSELQRDATNGVAQALWGRS